MGHTCEPKGWAMSWTNPTGSPGAHPLSSAILQGAMKRVGMASVVDYEEREILHGAPSGTSPAFFAVHEHAAQHSIPPLASGDFQVQKAALSLYVMERVTEVLGCPVEHDAHLMDAGLDSLGVSALRVELAKPVGMVMLAASAFFDYPTLGALVGYLATHLESDSMMPTREESWELVPSPVDMEATAPATELAIDSPSTTPSSPVDESSDSS